MTIERVYSSSLYYSSQIYIGFFLAAHLNHVITESSLCIHYKSVLQSDKGCISWFLVSAWLLNAHTWLKSILEKLMCTNFITTIKAPQLQRQQQVEWCYHSLHWFSCGLLGRCVLAVEWGAAVWRCQCPVAGCPCQPDSLKLNSSRCSVDNNNKTTSADLNMHDSYK